MLGSRVGGCAAVSWVVAMVLARPGSSRAEEPIEKRVQALVRLLGSENFDEREKAVQELIKVGARALEPLRKASASADPEVARLARVCIAKIEHNAKVDALLRKLRSTKPEEREEGSIGLCDLAPELEPIVPALIAALDDPDIQVREFVAVVLYHMGPKSEKALPKLLAILQDKSAGTNGLRLWVIRALKAMGPPAKQAVPILLIILETETPEMRMYAADGLGSLGQDDPKVGPALLLALSNRHIRVSLNSAYALHALRTEPERAVQAVMHILEHYPFKKEEMSVKASFIRLLGYYGPQAEPAITYLVKVCGDLGGDPAVRGDAKRALVKIGPAAYKALPGLKELGQDPPDYEFHELIKKATKP
jgi:HEAT repeat protein